MTDLQKSLCCFLAAGFLVVSAVGFQTSSPSGFAGGLCYLGTYVAGLAGLYFAARSIVGGRDGTEQEP